MATAGYKRPMPHISGAATGYHLEKYKHVYLPLSGWGGFYAIANASDQADIAVEDAVISAGVGNPSMGEVTDSGLAGLHIDAAGDDVRLFWPIPFDCDVESGIDFRVYYSSGSTTAADTHTWKVLYQEIAEGTQIDPSLSALSTAIAADTNDADKDAIQITAWGTLNGGTLTNGRIMIIAVELDATDSTLGSEAMYGYFLEIRYVRRAL